MLFPGIEIEDQTTEDESVEDRQADEVIRKSLKDILLATIKMGNGMNKILPGLYIGNFRDAKDNKQLNENNITHIVAVHDNAKKIVEDKEYLCILASDSPDQDLSKYFPQVIKFIHKARLDGGAVLVHCLAGVSRSVTLTAAYIMTVTDLGWRDALNSIRGARSVANPNFGFQKQLQNYENEHLDEERKKFKAQFPNNPFKDEEECRCNLKSFQEYVMNGTMPSRSDDLYPLPHRAYQGQVKKDAVRTNHIAKGTELSASSPNDSEPVISLECSSNVDGTKEENENSMQEAPQENVKNGQ
ncbi:dual specificity protein phosphatase 22-like isoform X2 [Physella acuta]|uniref:dual specificity protein phosphatase 22-like isoform X2 n=1 Tax=Physella acuta TaxID=109671 RepID=UPI0027DBB807|nr:dual specificity protein phosphatase 22-like isoform X2 [Physella acuta]